MDIDGILPVFIGQQGSVEDKTTVPGFLNIAQMVASWWFTRKMVADLLGKWWRTLLSNQPTTMGKWRFMT